MGGGHGTRVQPGITMGGGAIVGDGRSRSWRRPPWRGGEGWEGLAVQRPVAAATDEKWQVGCSLDAAEEGRIVLEPT